MLTNEGIKALREFGEKTQATIVTAKMNAPELDILETMLLRWKAQPAQELEQEIIDRFAVVREESFETPGPDY
jgi:hypothetical protein